MRWSDFGLPRDKHEALAALRDTYERAATQRVEIGCRSGVGRTGTALAAMAVMAGIPADEATSWVRERYHGRAVEMPWQREGVRNLEAA